MATTTSTSPTPPGHGGMDGINQGREVPFVIRQIKYLNNMGSEVQWNGYAELSITVPLHLIPIFVRNRKNVGAALAAISAVSRPRPLLV